MDNVCDSVSRSIDMHGSLLTLDDAGTSSTMLEQASWRHPGRFWPGKQEASGLGPIPWKRIDKHCKRPDIKPID